MAGAGEAEGGDPLAAPSLPKQTQMQPGAWSLGRHCDSDPTPAPANRRAGSAALLETRALACMIPQPRGLPFPKKNKQFLGTCVHIPRSRWVWQRRQDVSPRKRCKALPHESHSSQDSMVSVPAGGMLPRATRPCHARLGQRRTLRQSSACSTFPHSRGETPLHLVCPDAAEQTQES